MSDKNRVKVIHSDNGTSGYNWKILVTTVIDLGNVTKQEAHKKADQISVLLTQIRV